jgi:hypothetical protein
MSFDTQQQEMQHLILPYSFFLKENYIHILNPITDTEGSPS